MGSTAAPLRWAPPRARTDAALGVLCFGLYLAAAVWAKEMSLPGPILIWFPPAGVAIGFCYLRLRLVGVVVAAEVVSTTLVMDLAEEFGILPLLVNSVGIGATYGAAAWAMRRLRLDPRLRTPEDLLMLAFACLVIPVVAALIGVAVQVWIDLGEASDFGRDVAIFWLGDAIGALSLTPTIVLVGTALLTGSTPRLADDEADRNRLLLVGELLVPSVTAIWLMEIGGQPMRFVYLAFVPVVLLAVRHGISAAALSTACLGAVMTAGAHRQVAETIDRSDFQLLMLVLTLTGLTVGAVISARRDVLAEKARISEIIEATPDLVASVARDGTIRYLNPVGRQLLGLPLGKEVSQRAFEFLPDQLAQDLMREGMRAAERHGSWTGENRLRRSDGVVVPVSQVLIAHQDQDDSELVFSTVCRDATDSRRLEDQLRRAALYDDATQLPNRALLTEQLKRLVSLANGGHTAVLFSDVDHLDRVNETWGFNAGDQMITTIAKRIRALVRSQDLVARYGGAQFVVVLPSVPDEFEATLMADRILDCFAEPVPVDGHSLKVTGSVGIALTSPGQGHLEALRSAEIALHRAKEAGGGRFALFDEELEARARHRVEIETDLRDVIASGSWWLAYQPVVDSDTREITSVEALLRWTHPTRGPVSPFDLIRLAERSGSIVTLGREIFRRACEDATRWKASGLELGMAINVSARQLREPTFYDDVRAVIVDTGLPPECLTLELTETVLATDEHGEIDTLRRVRGLGCRVALDDFGTGYSTLSGLHDLPIDVVKLDRAFIRPLDESARMVATVEGVIRLARALGLEVVAEGVEHEEQVRVLTELGCHRLQGYAISHPLPEADLLALVEQARA